MKAMKAAIRRLETEIFRKRYRDGLTTEVAKDFGLDRAKLRQAFMEAHSGASPKRWVPAPIAVRDDGVASYRTLFRRNKEFREVEMARLAEDRAREAADREHNTKRRQAQAYANRGEEGVSTDCTQLGRGDLVTFQYRAGSPEEFAFIGWNPRQSRFWLVRIETCFKLSIRWDNNAERDAWLAQFRKTRVAYVPVCTP